MGYWKCPKCGAKDDTYEGTEIISGRKGGGGFVGVETDFGFVGGQAGGGSSPEHVTVRKCRKCDTILSDKDYFLTAKEKAIEARELRELQALAAAANKEAEQREPAEFAFKATFWVIYLGIGGGVLLGFSEDSTRDWGEEACAWLVLGWIPTLIISAIVKAAWPDKDSK